MINVLFIPRKAEGLRDFVDHVVQESFAQVRQADELFTGLVEFLLC